MSIRLCASIKIQIPVCPSGLTHLFIRSNRGVCASYAEECEQVKHVGIDGLTWKSCRGGSALLSCSFCLGILSKLFLQEPQFSPLENGDSSIYLVEVKGVSRGST